MLSFKYCGTHLLTDEMKKVFVGPTENTKLPFGQSSMLQVVLSPCLDTLLMVV